MTSPDPARYLDAAQRTWSFIEEQRASDGVCWNKTPDGQFAGHSYYHGTAGILVFLTNLAAYTGRQDLRDRITAPANALAEWLETAKINSINMSSGWISYQHALTQVWQFTGDDRFRDAAARCAAHVIEAASEIGGGVGWIEPAPFADITGFAEEREVVDLSIGSAGAILGLLAAADAGFDDRAAGLAVRAGDRLLEVAEQTPQGLRWLMMHPQPFPFPAPNYAHGGTGVAFALIELARRTGRQDFLDAAISTTRYALSHRVQCGAGSRIVHREDIEPPVFYSSLCHGPAGTGRTLISLAAITGSQEWIDAVDDLMIGLEAAGAPTLRENGLWNNYGQCCGDAGRASSHSCLPSATCGTARCRTRSPAANRSWRRRSRPTAADSPGTSASIAPARFRRTAGRVDAGRQRDRPLPASARRPPGRPMTPNGIDNLEGVLSADRESTPASR